jgi:hypothetical protein
MESAPWDVQRGKWWIRSGTLDPKTFWRWIRLRLTLHLVRWLTDGVTYSFTRSFLGFLIHESFWIVKSPLIFIRENFICLVKSLYVFLWLRVPIPIRVIFPSKPSVRPFYIKKWGSFRNSKYRIVTPRVQLSHFITIWYLFLVSDYHSQKRQNQYI